MAARTEGKLVEEIQSFLQNVSKLNPFCRTGAVVGKRLVVFARALGMPQIPLLMLLLIIFTRHPSRVLKARLHMLPRLPSPALLSKQGPLLQNSSPQ